MSKTDKIRDIREILVPPKPRVGFIGVGWIGRNRMDAVIESKLIEPYAIADSELNLLHKAAESASGAELYTDMDDLLDSNPDAVVIATPSALHAEQTIKALNKGAAVFCQKPLGRNSDEVVSVISAAKQNNKLLGVDFSYRFVSGVQKMRELIMNEAIGKIYAVNLVFHNAYGPDKEWFYNPKLSGGGCIIDLGIHLIDLALWITGFPKIVNVTSKLFSQGKPFYPDDEDKVEDYAIARIDLENDASLNLSCSWKLSAGYDAIIEASFYGTKGGLSMKNINGSFYHFITEHYNWTAREVIAEPPENWGTGAILNWTKKLTLNSGYDKEIEEVIKVTEVIDLIYNRNI